MDREPPEQGPPAQDAEQVFEEFQRRRSAGEPVEVEEYCRRHPELAHALRYLHSLSLETTEADEAPEETGEGPNSPATDTTVDYAVEDLVELELPEPGNRRSTLEAGSWVGSYRIIEAIGEGGFSIVYRAEQTAPVRREVALKTLKLGMDTREILARFDAERQTLALMSHSSIARVFDAGVAPSGAPFFVMEYVPGSPVTAYCDQRRLELPERLSLFIQVCRAVQHAHQKGIIHRDLKPSNVLVTEEGGKPLPKVIDFGIAKAVKQPLDRATLYTSTGQVIGTPAYMSPEQASGDADIDTRTDIYSLGVLLYELLVGVRPFELYRATPAAFRELERTIREDEPPRPSSRIRTLGDLSRDVARYRRSSIPRLGRELKGDLDWITSKALAKEPARRYASAAELGADIERHLRNEPVLAGPPGMAYRLAKFARRRRRALSTLGAAVLLAGLLGWAAYEVAETRRREEETRQSEQWIAQGKRALAEVVGPSRAKLKELESEHMYLRLSQDDWRPVWERQQELKAWRAVLDQRLHLEDGYTRALAAFTEALNLAPSGSEAFELAHSQIWGILDEIDNTKTGVMSRSILEQMVRFAGGKQKVLDAQAHVQISSDVAETEVYCFRYLLVPVEMRLLPLPFNPRAGDLHPTGEPFLRVERVWKPDMPPLKTHEGSDASFLPGDRLLQIGGRKLGLPSELAETLSGVEADKEVQLTVERAGLRLKLSWVPFPRSRYGESGLALPLAPGRLISFPEQLGISFEAYPLELDPAFLAGKASPGQPLEIVLPQGSYLLACRKEGHPVTRYPLEVPRFVEPGAQVNVEVSFLAQLGCPSGFVYVPGGPFTSGGDPAAYQALHTTGWVDAFFISRYEVTFLEYLRFLNHPETLARLATPQGNEGEVEPISEGAKRFTASFRSRGRGVQILPRNAKGQALVRRDGPGQGDGPWDAAVNPQWPVAGIPYVAMLEYADWLTRHAGDGWTYRLPTDLEWEKAARGADRRTYVWGDYLIWSYSWSFPANSWRLSKTPAPRGQVPFDESVYGVRDLEGSVEELTSELTQSPSQSELTFISRRGGSWDRADDNFFRLATRNGLSATAESRQVGFRLVAVRNAK